MPDASIADLVSTFKTKDKTLEVNVKNHIQDAGKVLPLFHTLSLEIRINKATGKLKFYIKSLLLS